MVDFDMPEMNGIEFCKQLKNKAIRRVLLTGKADEQVAIKAFNEGIIHQYIKKSDPNVFEKVTQYIREQQKEYFEQLSESMIKALSTESSSLFQDQVIIGLINKLRDENEFVEYYLVDEKSIVFLTENGEPSLLVIKTEDDITMDCDFAMDSGAPQDAIDKLTNKSHIAAIEDLDDFASLQGEAWNQYIHEATSINGDKPYYYTMINDSKAIPEKDKTIYSYENFLDEVDS